jgi:hypothetical protein
MLSKSSQTSTRVLTRHVSRSVALRLPLPAELASTNLATLQTRVGTALVTRSTTLSRDTARIELL